MPPLTRKVFLLAAAAVCFLVGLFVTLGANVAGSTTTEWELGGLLALTLSSLA